MLMLKRRQLLALLSTLPLTGPNAGASDIMEYRYRDKANTARRDAYQIALLKLALDKTEARDGPYRIVHFNEQVTPRRLLLEMNDGRRINIFVGAARTANAGLAHHEHIAVPFSILGRLVGFRVPIVHRSDLARFAAIDTLEQLKRMRAGQGADWIDSRILRHNGFRLDDSGQLSNLLPMLALRRFDYLPIGIVEVDSLLARHPDIAAQFAVAPGLAIEYPLPMIYYVSNKVPELAARLLRGLRAADRDGSVEQLMRKHFGAELKVIRQGGARHFKIANPFLPPE